MRRALFAVALAASWCLLLLWAADIDWRMPFAPATQRDFAGSAFHAVFGSATAQASRLHVSAPAQDFSALQSTALADVRAADFPVLRYRFENFPRTLELSLLFRTAAVPDDVQTISLPWPGSGVATFDLSQVDAWKGTIVELGFAQFATAQNVPPELGFRPFDLVEAQLWSPSWRGDLAALVTDWFGAWPWSQRSVHALGREGEAPRAHSAVLFAGLAAAIAIGWSALLLGLRGRRLLGTVVLCAALAWLALDLRWHAGLVHRLLATRTLYAHLDWPGRAQIVGDSEIEHAAMQLKALLRDEPAQTRILVQAGSRYQALRMIWHLLPLDVAEYAFAQPFGAALPEDCLLVFYDSDAWRSNPPLRKLLVHSRRLRVPVPPAGGVDKGRMVVFRYRHAR
ncbi:MAG: hypothetical protein ACHP7D_05745 [Lysobacterales bacterium]